MFQKKIESHALRPLTEEWISLPKGNHQIDAINCNAAYFITNIVGKSFVNEHQNPKVFLTGACVVRISKGTEFQISSDKSITLLKILFRDRTDKYSETISVIVDPILDHCAEILNIYRNAKSPQHDLFASGWISMVVERSKWLTVQPSSNTKERESDLDKYLSERIAYPISTEDLRSRLNLSRCAFFKWFKINFSISPWQYILKFRVTKARELLLFTDRSISEVAMKTGFASQTHLTSTFQRFYKSSPKKFRHNNSVSFKKIYLNQLHDISGNHPARTGGP